MATQKVPLTRIDPTGASEGKVLKYSSGALAWGDDNNSGGGGGGGSGQSFKNTILATESVSANSLEQYQVHSGLEILSGGSFTIAASGDLVLDAPDDPHKAAGWTDSGNVIHTTDHLNNVSIGTSSTDATLTVAGSVSAQGDVYGNARTMTNPGVVLQVVNVALQENVTTTSNTFVDSPLSAAITPTYSNSKIKISYHVIGGSSNGIGVPLRIKRDIGGTISTDILIAASDDSQPAGAATTYYTGYAGSSYTGFHMGIDALDTPNTTNEVKYIIQFCEAYASQSAAYINRSAVPAQDYSYSSCSSITLTEIAQ